MLVCEAGWQKYRLPSDEIEEHDVVVVAKADGDWLGVVSLVLLKRKLEQLHFFSVFTTIISHWMPRREKRESLAMTSQRWEYSSYILICSKKGCADTTSGSR